MISAWWSIVPVVLFVLTCRMAWLAGYWERKYNEQNESSGNFSWYCFLIDQLSNARKQLKPLQEEAKRLSGKLEDEVSRLRSRITRQDKLIVRKKRVIENQREMINAIATGGCLAVRNRKPLLPTVEVELINGLGKELTVKRELIFKGGTINPELDKIAITIGKIKN